MTDLVLLPDEKPKRVFTDALELGFDAFLAPDGVQDDLGDLGKARFYVRDGDRILAEGEEVGRWVEIAAGEDQEAVRELAGSVDLVAVETTDWTVIPLENLISWFDGTGTELLAVVDDAEAARLALGALELGVDGLVVRAGDRGTLSEIRDVTRAEGGQIELTTAEVADVRAVGSGDRVCIDTTTLMEVGQGMLVGSQAQALFFVHSETRETAYVASRPFRVNAGPVHAYVLAPDGSTRYLSELRAGDEVLITDAKGRTRTAVVGRVKIEERPLILVEVEVAGRTVSTILQNAETVALMTPDGPRSVVDLEPGDEVLVRIGAEGRHFGTAVEERVVER